MSRRSELEGLLGRVREATGSDQELDARLICALAAPEGATVEQSPINGAWVIYFGVERSGRPRAWPMPMPWRLNHMSPSGSVDAALALVERVLPGWQWLIRNREDGAFFANLHAYGVKLNEGGECFPSEASIAPLAILNAVLQALIAREADDAD